MVVLSYGVWYNRHMELSNNIVTLLSHLVFIIMTHQILRNLFDWSNIIKNPTENLGRLKVFILFISIAVGYLVSHFVLDVVLASQSIFFVIQ